MLNVPCDSIAETPALVDKGRGEDMQLPSRKCYCPEWLECLQGGFHGDKLSDYFFSFLSLEVGEERIGANEKKKETVVGRLGR